MSELHEMQRAMRAMRRAALQRGVIAVLDVGSFKVSCLVLRFDGGEPDVLDGVGPMSGQSRFQVIGAATTRSRGVRFGEIATMRETESAVRTAITQAQRAAQVRVDHVVACLAGAEPRSIGLSGEIELGGDPVTEGHIASVLSECEHEEDATRHALHAHPVNFSLDHRSGLSDPRGKTGERLGCDMHLVSVDTRAIHDLEHALRRCDLELAGVAAAPYAAGLAALVEDEQELGCACIDMGGGATGISVFMQKHMVFASSVRMGGEHVSLDVSKGLQISLSAAERIKVRHGGLVATGQDDLEMIPVGGETGDWELDRRCVSRAELIGIVRPRVEEILEECRLRLDEAEFDSMPTRQVVLTGGASQIPGLDELATRILGCRVRLGRPLRLRGLPQDHAEAGHSGLVGLCLVAAHPQDEWWDFEAPASHYPARSLKRAVRWFRDNW